MLRVTEQTRSVAAYFVGCLSAVIGLALFSGSFLVDQDLSQASAAEKGAANKAPGKIAFDSHIRPLLSDKCFLCHGPD